MRTVKSSIDAARRTCVPIAAAIALVAASGLAGVFAEAQAASQSECISEFRDSDASSTCELATANASGDNCTLRRALPRAYRRLDRNFNYGGT